MHCTTTSAVQCLCTEQFAVGGTPSKCLTRAVFTCKRPPFNEWSIFWRVGCSVCACMQARRLHDDACASYLSADQQPILCFSSYWMCCVVDFPRPIFLQLPRSCTCSTLYCIVQHSKHSLRSRTDTLGQLLCTLSFDCLVFSLCCHSFLCGICIVLQLFCIMAVLPLFIWITSAHDTQLSRQIRML